jgi:hypothetical protein
MFAVRENRAAGVVRWLRVDGTWSFNAADAAPFASFVEATVALRDWCGRRGLSPAGTGDYFYSIEEMTAAPGG